MVSIVLSRSAFLIQIVVDNTNIAIQTSIIFDKSVYIFFNDLTIIISN